MQWEYNVVTVEAHLAESEVNEERILNEHGESGWELVNVIRMYHLGWNKDAHRFYFKRPR